MLAKVGQSQTSSAETENDLAEFDRDYVRIALAWAWRAKRDKRQRRHCKLARLAAIRFLRDLERAKDPECAFYFDPWHACDPCDFVEKLPHVEGEWDSDTLHLEAWQIFELVNLFGFRRRSDGHRRFNTMYKEVARKNGKSAFVAGIALYCETCEGEPGPQVKIGATTGSQARIVFDVAKKMVEKTPDLQEAFGLVPMANAIVCNDNLGSMQPINAKASTQDGLNPHCTVLDELHAHEKRDLFDVLKSARGARKNPLSIYITTAGYNVQGVCYEQRTLLTKILEGLIEADHYFGIIFTLDEDDDPLDPAVWCKANPNLDVSVQSHELETYAGEARISPASLYEFKTKRCNIWTTAKGAWLNIELWKACDGSRIDYKALKDQPCYGGLDLATTTDIAAWVLIWDIDGWLTIRPRFYVPEMAIEPRTKQGNVPYMVWRDQGYLTATPGNVTDYAYIEKDIKADMDAFMIEGIGYDPWNASDLTNRLVEEGAPMIEFRQGPKSYNPPMRELERRVKSKMIRHGNNPVLAWMASNLVAREDVNKNMAPDKKNSQEKIDGMVSALMGLGLSLLNIDNVKAYEEHGLRIL